MISRGFKDFQVSIKDEVKQLKIKEQAESRLVKAGIPKPKKPTQEVLDFPDDVTSIPDVDLGMYLGMYEASAAWTYYCISRREIDLEHAKVLMSFVQSKLLTDITGKTKTERLEKIITNDFYLDCVMELQGIVADLKLLEASKSSVHRYSRSISREITNRGLTSDAFPKRRVALVNTDQEGVFGNGND